jgi:hypothetical protein
MTSGTIKKPPTLCRLCVIVRDQPSMKPVHLVHPVTGDLMLFDGRGEAVCPTCGARYRKESRWCSNSAAACTDRTVAGFITPQTN